MLLNAGCSVVKDLIDNVVDDVKGAASDVVDEVKDFTDNMIDEDESISADLSEESNSTPEGAVKMFINAWKNNNIETMQEVFMGETWDMSLYAENGESDLETTLNNMLLEKTLELDFDVKSTANQVVQLFSGEYVDMAYVTVEFTNYNLAVIRFTFSRFLKDPLSYAISDAGMSASEANNMSEYDIENMIMTYANESLADVKKDLKITAVIALINNNEQWFITEDIFYNDDFGNAILGGYPSPGLW
jgi:hypothetical protein